VMRKKLEFRFYDMPRDNPVLALYGEKWKMVYGDDDETLHFHNVLEIGLCREGQGEMIYENETRPYGPDMISIIPGGGMPHCTYSRDRSKSWWEYVFIDVHQYLHKAYPENVRFGSALEAHINSRYLLEKREDNEELWNLTDGIIKEEKGVEPYAKEIVNQKVIELLLLLARKNRSFDHSQDEETRTRGNQIHKGIVYIEKNYAEKFSIGDIASEIGMSETHFRRLFNETMRMPPSSYVNMIRIQHACRMLAETDLPVELIAEKAGYASVSTFNRNFKEFMGETPLKWKYSDRNSPNLRRGMQIKAYKGWN